MFGTPREINSYINGNFDSLPRQIIEREGLIKSSSLFLLHLNILPF